MDRRNFTKVCLSCVGFTAMIPVIQGCQAVHYANGAIETDGMSVPVSEFKYLKKDKEMIRQFILVRNDSLQFPIYLYRHSENDYSALLMKCTHQGNELSASGDHLTCSAHGSEFNNQGTVKHGPAERNLRKFNVNVTDEKIFIDLRA